MHKTTYAPVIYTAPCIMFWMGAYTLLGEVGGGWALEFPSFLRMRRGGLLALGAAECGLGFEGKVKG